MKYLLVLGSVIVGLAVCVSCGSSNETRDREALGDPKPATASAKKRSAALPDDLVRLTVLADTTRISSGQTFTLAARFDIEPGWHLYWENPGETGLPTQATFKAPKDFEISDPRYPGPMSFDSPGEVVSYGYDDTFLLSVEVTAPDKLVPGKDERSGVLFEMHATWLACREVCIRGQGAAAVDLPVATAEQPATMAHGPLFESHRGRLPKPFATLEGAAHDTEMTETQGKLSIEVMGAQRLAYFPRSEEDLNLVGQASIPGEDRSKLEISFAKGKPIVAGGVLAVTGKDRTDYYQLSISEGAQK